MPFDAFLVERRIVDYSRLFIEDRHVTLDLLG